MNGKIKTGILGAGQPNIATSHQLPASLRSEKLELTTLCDMNPAVNDVARKYGLQAFTDYAQMLLSGDVEMIQIATPDWCHCAHTEMALKAGKHVLLQKPPCLNMDELSKLVTAMKNSSGSLKVLLNCRATRLCRSIKKYIDDGIIGGLREIIITYRGRRFPIDNPQSRYLKAECGGAWLHNAMHWLDEAFFYSGSLPRAVQAFTARNDNGEARFLGDGPNYWSAIFPMSNGVSFNFEYNTMLLADGLPGGMRRSIIGEKGEIRQSYGATDILCFRPGKEAEKLPLLDAELSPEEDILESFRRALDAYALQIKTGKEEAPEIYNSLFLMKTLILAAESAETEKSITPENFNENI